jgi:hypothetical protein
LIAVGEHLAIRLALRVVRSGSEYRRATSLGEPGDRSIPGASLAWFPAIAVAPAKAQTKQLKNTSGERGIGALVNASATSTAQNGARSRIAVTITGCALTKLTL